jgi:hypothetical protein
MRTVELGEGDARELRKNEPRVRARAHVDAPAGEPREGSDPEREIPGALGHDPLRGRSERLALDGGDEDRARLAPGVGDAGEGTGAKRRPQTRCEQERLDPLAREPRDLVFPDGIEALGFLALEVDHDRLEAPPCASRDLAHHPGAR